MKHPTLDLITRCFLAISYLFLVGYATWNLTATWPDWAGGIATGVAVVAHGWLFLSVFWVLPYEDCEHTTTDTQLPAA